LRPYLDISASKHTVLWLVILRRLAANKLNAWYAVAAQSPFFAMLVSVTNDRAMIAAGKSGRGLASRAGREKEGLQGSAFAGKQATLMSFVFAASVPSNQLVKHLIINPSTTVDHAR